MSWLLVSCLLTPLVTAVLCFMLPSYRGMQCTISVIGATLLVVLSALLMSSVWSNGVVAAQMGDWPAPFGITLVADTFSAIMVLVSSVISLAVCLYAIADIDGERLAGGFNGFTHVLMTGVIGAFLTGDLFNLYVWFEVLLIASFALMTLAGDRIQLDGAVKYVSINLVSTVLLLTAIGLTYGLTGSLNLADLNGRLAQIEAQELASVVGTLFLIAFGIKAAVFPLFFWLPASYHTPPMSVVALFAALMTKVGVYALIRTFTMLFTDESMIIEEIILVVALATMISGVLGAMAYDDIRRILAFHIIASIGFMLFGLGLGTPAALAASIFYIVHGMLVKATLFMVAGIVGRLGGSFSLTELGGLYRERPLFAVGFLLAAFSLIGFPPLSGFWAKVMIIEAGLDAGAPFVLFVVLLTSLMTFIPLMRIWAGAFWQKRPENSRAPAVSGAGSGVDANVDKTHFTASDSIRENADENERIGTDVSFADPLGVLMVPMVFLTLVTLAIGLAPSTLIGAADRAAETLTEPSSYIEAVLGDGGGGSLGMDPDAADSADAPPSEAQDGERSLDGSADADNDDEVSE